MIGVFALTLMTLVPAQTTNTVVDQIVQEAMENSQVERLTYELVDEIGPRLVGSPKMQQAHDWAVSRFQAWGITAKNEAWGEWRSWERGISHIEMHEPYVKSLEGRQLAFSPKTPSRGITAEVIALPVFTSKAEFDTWLPKVKGKIVLMSQYQPSGRPDYNWKEHATAELYEKYTQEKAKADEAWNNSMRELGYNFRTVQNALEDGGAAGIIMSFWSGGFGVSRIFNATTKKIPVVDVALEDYGQLHRLVQNGKTPKVKIVADSKEHGMKPTYNTIAEIKGSSLANEYVLLSAHIDSWDGGTGATDNATGVVTMMEVARILKKYYPNPKRTIIVGLWGSEEQGLNGSRAYVMDNADKMQNIQAVFNQDNGTGRISSVNGQGFLHAYDYLGRWFAGVPDKFTRDINFTFPGSPGGGGSDHASFVAAGVPAFMLISHNWSYGTYTWHTQRDTYDKIVFDEVKNNVALIAALTYMASEDDQKASRERINLPINQRTGEQRTWPEVREPNRRGGVQ